MDKSIFFNVDNLYLGALYILIWLIVTIVINLDKIKKLKNTISEVRKGLTKKKILLIIIGLIIGYVFMCIGLNQYRERTEITIVQNGEVIYPLGIDMKQKAEVGKYTFFIYNTKDEYGEYPVLYRWKKGQHAEIVSERACKHFEIINDTVVYLDSTIGDLSHGELRAKRPDGKNERIVDEEIWDFIVADDKIFFSYCLDTIGATFDGHALYKMDLNGDNKEIVAYEVNGPDLEGNHFNFSICDNWVNYNNYKVELGNPADGAETVVYTGDKELEWIYYSTNKLYKARPDGTELTELDGAANFYYCVNEVKDGKIYYTKDNNQYVIDCDGTNKKIIE